MAASALNRRYEEALERHRKTRPQLADPWHPTLYPAAWVASPVLAMLGALCVARADYPTAKAWFRVGLLANLDGFESEKAQLQGWPSYSEKDASVPLLSTIEKSCMFARLCLPSVAQEPWVPGLRPGIDWLEREMDRELDNLYRKEPIPDAMGISNSVANNLLLSGFLPAFVFGDQTLTDRIRSRAEAYVQWHQRIGGDETELLKMGFVGLIEVKFAISISSRNRISFFENLSRAAAALRFSKEDTYNEKCHPVYLAFYLEAHARLGPFPSAMIRGIPEELDLNAYWAAH